MPSIRPIDQFHDEAEMSFLDHLEALRWHLMRSVASVLVFAIAAFIAKDFIFGTVIFGPARVDFWTYKMLCKYTGDCIKDVGFQLVSTEMGGQFSQHISVSFTTGICLSVPYFGFEMWRFFRPALKAAERKYVIYILGAASALFFGGLVFGYFFLTPVSVQFLGNYTVGTKDIAVHNYTNLESYIEIVTMTCLSTALVFELPIVVYFLSLAGILTPFLMRKFRRHAIVVIIILAAVITPSTDITSQLMLALPFIGLYELSIFISATVLRNKLRKAKRDAGNSITLND